MEEPRKELINTFMRKLQEIDDLYEQYAKSMGLTSVSLYILEIIYTENCICTQKQICEKTHYPKQTVNVVIKNFWEQGYVELKEIPSDRRNKSIALTAKGKEYAKVCIERIYSIEEKAFGKLKIEQLRQMTDYMIIFKNDLQESIEG